MVAVCVTCVIALGQDEPTARTLTPYLAAAVVPVQARVADVPSTVVVSAAGAGPATVNGTLDVKLPGLPSASSAATLNE